MGSAIKPLTLVVIGAVAIAALVVALIPSKDTSNRVVAQQPKVVQVSNAQLGRMAEQLNAGEAKVAAGVVVTSQKVVKVVRNGNKAVVTLRSVTSTGEIFQEEVYLYSGSWAGEVLKVTGVGSVSTKTPKA